MYNSEDNKRLQDLMDKFIEDNLSEDESQELNRWYDAHTEEDFFADYPEVDKQIFRSVMFENVLDGAGITSKVKRYPLWPIIRVAAAVLFVLGISLYWLSAPDVPSESIASSSILPSSHEAIIELSDGKVMDLASLTIGDTAIDNGMTIYKNQMGEIVYRNSDNLSQGWNTVRSPAGVIVRMVLPDGSRVALNANSTLRYSLNMIHDAVRRIELDGEAYFIVEKKQDKQPFVVSTGLQEVHVLGTVFNVAAYSGAKDIKASLQEGHIAFQVDPAVPLVHLKPSQQIIVQKEGLKYTVRPFNAVAELDWVDANFVFDNEKLLSVIKRIADWYQLDVDVPSEVVAKQTVYGAIARNKPLNEILEVLEQSVGIEFVVRQGTQGKPVLTIRN